MSKHVMSGRSDNGGKTDAALSRRTPKLPAQCIKVIKPVGLAGRPAVYCSKTALPGSRYCEDHQ